MDVYNYDNLTSSTLVIGGYTIPPYGEVVSNGSTITVLDDASDGISLQKSLNGRIVSTNIKGSAIQQIALSALAKNFVGADAVAPIGMPSAAVGAAGALTGVYYYGVSYLLNDGSVTPPCPGTPIAVTLSSQQSNVSSIPISPSTQVVGRVLLRTVANPTDPKAYLVLTTINNNTATTYVDNIADGSLGAAANWLGSSGGLLTTSSGLVLQGLAGEAQSLAIGYGTKAGYASLALCYGALSSVTIGRRNVALGTYSYTSLTTGYENVGVGVHSGQYLTTGVGNVFLGYVAGFNSNGTCNFNVAVGRGALNGTTAGLGQFNTALGASALLNINTADGCIGIGHYAGQFANASRQLFIDTGGTSRAALTNEQNEGLIYGEIPTGANYAAMTQTQRINLNGSVRLGTSTTPTVANLPAAVAGLQGCRRYVTDSSVAASGNYGATVAGGGSNCVPVFCTGSAWIIA